MKSLDTVYNQSTLWHGALTRLIAAYFQVHFKNLKSYRYHRIMGNWLGRADSSPTYAKSTLLQSVDDSKDSIERLEIKLNEPGDIGLALAEEKYKVAINMLIQVRALQHLCHSLPLSVRDTINRLERRADELVKTTYEAKINGAPAA